MEADILIVDDDPGTIQVLARILTGLGKLRFATDGKTALRMARKQRPDLMLLDAEMPGMNGYLVCEIMKGDPELVDVAVMFITSYAGLKFEVAGLEMGAADFISKPVSEPLLVARVKTQLRVKRLTDQLRDVAHIDALTEISNRRRFDELLNLEWLRGLREGHPVALLLADVDHFKLFNDAYGHPAGDVCLRMVAQALSSACRRPADLVARIGGEEFAVLMPNTPLDGAEQ
ncbi:MAG: diguanylate cyclase, partial [Burkholderiaceae bacterium]|nr:diguanylate cyclase [Burkholderiaceae bacterium]